MAALPVGQEAGACNLLNADPPAHARLRAAVPLPAGRVAALRPWVQELVDRLIDEFAGRGTVELVGALTARLPFHVVCEIAGFAPELRVDLERAVDAAARYGHGEAGARAHRQLTAVVSRQLSHHHAPPGSLLDALARARAAGKIDAAEEVGQAAIVVSAGHATTVNMLNNAIVALLTHPEQNAQLRECPSMMDTAVEELLRFDGPVWAAPLRVAREDVSIDGMIIPAGDVVSLLLGSANRDPEAFTHPDALDLTRAPNPHVAFGRGIHYCLGAQLARMEAEVAITTLLRRLAGLQLACPPDELRWQRRPVVRGPVAVPLRFNPS
ncbi:cytochrome P450 [Streptomyces sp. FIT100]|uniref:cytochrome P450 n=1 Tax=Streptomyces sp. FIT100 TaxID=2837956 RepID=UPI0021C5AC41|nr:cytochrome P450 [Streptomyces sp. FIT100]UUN30056.1 cytochrome P450 [Streptomyces sp. FIT100]